MSHRALALIAALLLAGCAGTVPPLPDDAPPAAHHIRATLQDLVYAGTNAGRQGVVVRHLRAAGCEPELQWIDYSWQSNVLVEIPGESDRIVYVVAHYDRCAADPLHLLNVLTLGLLGPVADLTSWMSDGALDNGGGVSVAIALARHAKAHKPPRTVRVLLTGCEEIGLRGARTHVGRLSDAEWARIDAVINVDGVGAAQGSLVVAGEEGLRQRVLATAGARDLEASAWRVPAGVSSDDTAFASPGGDVARGLLYSGPLALLPQRSWGGSGRQGVPAVWIGEAVGAHVPLLFLPLPVGPVHGPRDSASSIDLDRLHRVYELVKAVVYQAPR